MFLRTDFVVFLVAVKQIEEKAEADPRTRVATESFMVLLILVVPQKYVDVV